MAGLSHIRHEMSASDHQSNTTWPRRSALLYLNDGAIRHDAGLGHDQDAVPVHARQGGMDIQLGGKGAERAEQGGEEAKAAEQEREEAEMRQVSSG